MPAGGVVGPVDTVSIGRSGVHVLQVAVPDLVGVLGQIDTRLARLVEQAQLDPCRMRREQRKIDSLPIPSSAPRMRQTPADRALADCDHIRSCWLTKAV